MPASPLKPIIGVPAGFNQDSTRPTPHHGVGGKYMQAIMAGANAVPVMIPAFGTDLCFDTLLNVMDGLLLTGGRANVEPHHYGGPPFPDDEYIDPARDSTVLPLVRACVDRGIPVFGICRGIQEMNVAMGGTLHYRVHVLDGKMDHRMRRDTEDMELRFGPRHLIALTEGGYLHSLLGETETIVNSLHGQAIDRPAPGFEIEAVAEDGVIEAVRMPSAKNFTIGVQWHAEWRFDEHPLGTRLFEEFGNAARAHALRRSRDRVA